jgi:integrase
VFCGSRRAASDCLSLRQPALHRVGYPPASYSFALACRQVRELSEIRPELCAQYVAWRTAQKDARATVNVGRSIKPSTARRELVTLSASLGWCYRNHKLDRPIPVALPAVAEPRERYLKRQEVAALLWAALGFDREGTRNQFRINRHLARFILVGLYTGTRHDAILSLQWQPNVVGGWFDIDAGILYRRPQDAIETNKKRTPAPIAPRLLPHLRRWRKHSTQYVIEYDGKPISSQLRRAWNGARDLAGLSGDVTPHVLKHSCATLMLQAGVSTWRVARLLGTSEQVIQRTYGHHAIDDLRAAIGMWSNRERPTEIPPTTSKRTGTKRGESTEKR